MKIAIKLDMLDFRNDIVLLETINIKKSPIEDKKLEEYLKEMI